MNERKGPYFSIIPAEIKFDNDLSDKAKFLYGDILGLSNHEGFCYASNKYFADIYGVTKSAVSNWFGQLENKGYIKREINKKEGNKRKVFPQVGVGPGGYSAHMNRGYSAHMNRSSADMNRGDSENVDSNKDEAGKNTSNNINNNIKFEEEEPPTWMNKSSNKIPPAIKKKYKQVFNRELSDDFYQKLISICPEPDILMLALEVAEEKGDKPSYLLKILEDWSERGLDTVDDILNYIEQRESQNSSKASSSHSSGSLSEKAKELLDAESLQARDDWN